MPLLVPAAAGTAVPQRPPPRVEPRRQLHRTLRPGALRTRASARPGDGGPTASGGVGLAEPRRQPLELRVPSATAAGRRGTAPPWRPSRREPPASAARRAGSGRRRRRRGQGRAWRRAVSRGRRPALGHLNDIPLASLSHQHRSPEGTYPAGWARRTHLHFRGPVGCARHASSRLPRGGRRPPAGDRRGRHPGAVRSVAAPPAAGGRSSPQGPDRSAPAAASVPRAVQSALDCRLAVRGPVGRACRPPAEAGS